MRPLRRLSLTLSCLSLAYALLPGEAAADMLGTEDLMAVTRQTEAAVERLRGLKFKSPVAVRVVDSKTAREHFQARITKFMPEQQVRYDESVYAQLGLLPPGTDLMKTMLDVLDEQAWGYYDPDSKTFFVRGDIPQQTAGILVAHELTHALDDQYYGIDRLVERVKDDDDRALAISAVAEGSATVVMSLYILDQVQSGKLGLAALAEMQQSEAEKAQKLSQAPAYLQRSLLGPYLLGQAFLLHGNPMQLMSLQPADIDRAFTDPPVSSEQLLHPEKYWTPGKIDLPARVLLPNVSGMLGPGWKLAATGTLGELTLAVLTGVGPVNMTDPSVAQLAGWTDAAATGWSGDLYHYYVDGEGRGATVALTAWDSPAEASEFQAALTPVAGRTSYRRGNLVVLMGGAAASPGQRLAQAIFDALRPAGK
jgi:hypothetical protein